MIPKNRKKSRKKQPPIDLGEAGEESLADVNTVTSTNNKITAARKPRHNNNIQD